MTSIAQLRAAALALPETVEMPAEVSGGTRAAPTRAEVVAFAVRGALFAAAAEGVVRLSLPTEDVERVLTEHPSASRVQASAGPATTTAVGVDVPLADLDGQQLNHWVRRAWFATAPQELGAALAAADTAEPGQVGDLPASIGRPATRALAGAGLTSLADVARRTDAELLALHGVGPKAVRLLREAAASR